MNPQSKRPLDPVPKLGLGVLLGSFILIGMGMFLSRPDRSIPPYSIGAQAETVVAVHVPSWTSDPEIQTLLQRFRAVGQDTGNFGQMKIQPTTPDDPQGWYQRITIYIFANHEWAMPDVLHRYLTLGVPDNSEEQQFQNEFEAEVRGGFVFHPEGMKGWLGPLGWEKTVMPDFAHQVLFEETRALDVSGHESPVTP